MSTGGSTLAFIPRLRTSWKKTLEPRDDTSPEKAEVTMPDKVVLAYSGGLDTSVAIKWIKEKYNLDVIGGTSPRQVERALAIAKKMVSSGK